MDDSIAPVGFYESGKRYAWILHADGHPLYYVAATRMAKNYPATDSERADWHRGIQDYVNAREE